MYPIVFKRFISCSFYDDLVVKCYFLNFFVILDFLTKFKIHIYKKKNHSIESTYNILYAVVHGNYFN